MSKPVSFYTAGQMIEELSKSDPSTPIFSRNEYYDRIQPVERPIKVRLIKMCDDFGGFYIPCSILDEKSIKAIVIDDYEFE